MLKLNVDSALLRIAFAPDCRQDGADRLQNFYVMTSTSPFTSNTLANARNQADQEYYNPGSAGLPSAWDFPGGEVRYVRVQRASYGYLTLAEFEISGCLVDGNQNFELPIEVMTPNFAVKNLFPNPTSGEVIAQIESDFVGKVSIQVVNVLGQLKWEETISLESGVNSRIWNFDNLDNGIYNVVFFDDKNNRVTKKLVIAK